MVLNGSQWFSRVFNGFQWFSRVFKGFQGFSMVFNGSQGFSKIPKWFSRVFKGFQVGFSINILEQSPYSGVFEQSHTAAGSLSRALQQGILCVAYSGVFEYAIWATL